MFQWQLILQVLEAVALAEHGANVMVGVDGTSGVSQSTGMDAEKGMATKEGFGSLGCGTCGGLE